MAVLAGEQLSVPFQAGIEHLVPGSTKGDERGYRENDDAESAEPDVAEQRREREGATDRQCHLREATMR